MSFDDFVEYLLSSEDNEGLAIIVAGEESCQSTYDRLIDESRSRQHESVIGNTVEEVEPLNHDRLREAIAKGLGHKMERLAVYEVAKLLNIAPSLLSQLSKGKKSEYEAWKLDGSLAVGKERGSLPKA